MRLHYLKSLSALALAGMFALNANAETVNDEFTVNFADYEIGKTFNTFWGNPNPNIAIVANPKGEADGNVLYVSGVDLDENGDPQLNEGGGKVWNTLARIPGLALPKGYNLSQVAMIEAEFMPMQDDKQPFGLQLRNPDSDYYIFDSEATVGEWNTAVFDGQGFVNGEGNALDSKASSFDLCFGIKGSTEYYVRSITFYLEKEMTQREIDEEALDKTTAACVSLDFNDMPEGPSPYLGSNGGATNREDMVFDKGPEGYDNMCAHIIYGGWTNIFLWNMITAPDGYNFDDLRLVEYDIYETTIAGRDCTNGEEFPYANGAPQLKVKQAPWQMESNSGSCGNAQLPSTNEWHHVEFLPSAIDWPSRTIKRDVLDENGQPVKNDNGENVQEEITYTPEEVCAQFGQLTSFAISIGFFPCNNQCYVDNVKLWFQKGGTSGVEAVKVAPEFKDYTVYNLMGIQVMKTADKADLNNLPAGIYVVNGKKYLVK